MRHARFPALVVVVALAAAACSSSGADPEPTATPTTSESATPSASPSPSATASEVDLSAPPPDDVTEEYVQNVLEAIYAVEAETIRVDVAADEQGATTPPKESLDLFKTIYDGDQLVFALRDAASAWEDGDLKVAFRANPQPSEVKVNEVVDVGPDCIVATFRRNDSPTLVEQVEPVELIALLEPKPEGVDPTGANKAPWVITEQAVVSPEVEGSCADS